MTRRGSDVHYLREEHTPPPCGVEEYENITANPNEVTCLICGAWILEQERGAADEPSGPQA